MPSSHLILCHPLLLLAPISPSIRVFSNESTLRMRWPGQSIGVSVSASASVLPINTQDCSPLGWTGWISLWSKELSRVFSNTTVQKHQFFGAQLSGPITSSQIKGEKVEAGTYFLFLGSKITADSNYSHEIRRQLFLGKKAMTNLDSVLKSKDITLLTKVCIVKAIVFSVVI